MKWIVVAAALGAFACATVSEGEDRQCRVERLAALEGREATNALGAEALRRSGARTLRWIRPGDAVTMDYRADRLNIRLDGRGMVEGFSCG